MQVLKKDDLLKLNGQYCEIYEFLKNNDLSKMQLGRHDISNNCYVNIMEYKTKNEVSVDYEAHRIYDDVHCVIDGEERIEVQDISKAQQVSDYNQEGDYQFFTCSSAENCVLKVGDFVIFAPSDVHKPQLAVEQEKVILKAVFKVKRRL